MLLVEFLKHQSKLSSSNQAAIDSASGDSITYGELWKRVDKASSMFLSQGLQSQDRVMMALPNCIDWIVYCLAVINAGAVFVPVKTTAMPWEMKKLINQTQPVMFIGDAAFINKSLPFDIENSDKRIAVASGKFLRRNKGDGRIIDLRNVVKKTSDREVHGKESNAETDLVSINYTYRGYGFPLGAMMSHRNFVEGIKAYINTGELTRNHHFLSVLPFGYSYPFVGCILVPLATGSTIHLCDAVSQKKLMSMLDGGLVDVLTATPSIYSMISSAGRQKMLQNVKHAYCGGSAMPPSLFDAFKNSFGVELRQGYGLTECLPVVCNSSAGNRPDTVGKPLVGADGLRVAIVDESGNRLPEGTRGEIAVKGSTVMRGYWRADEPTKDVFKKGWMLTGDFGRVDKSGYVYFDGLKKRIIKVGGNMVDVAEVENRVASVDGVEYVKGYGVADARWGTVVGVDVKMSDNNFDEKRLKRRLRRYMASYKIPRIVKEIK